MNPSPQVQVRSLDAAEHEAAVDVLVGAFRTYPTTRWLVAPSLGAKDAALAALIGFFLNPPRPEGRGFPRQSAAIPEGVARLTTSTAAGRKPALARTFLAAFRSRSTRTPQAGQWNVRSDKLNRPLALA